MVFCLRSSSVNGPFPSWLADLACHVSKNGKILNELLFFGIFFVVATTKLTIREAASVRVANN